MSYKTEVYLKKGWNLVSFFLKEIDVNMFTQNENIIEIKDLQHSYHKDLPVTNLESLNINSAYLINSNKDTLIPITGIINKQVITYNLKKGWNLVGYPFRFGCNIDTIANNPKVLEIKNGSFNYNSMLPKKLNTLKDFEVGYGYWFKVEDDTDISMEYPFVYNFVKDNKLNGLVLVDDLFPDELKDNFSKVNYKINITDESIVEIPMSFRPRNLTHTELNELMKNLDGIKFSIYHGNFNNESNIVGVDFHSDLSLPSVFTGNVKFIPRKYDSNNKIIEIYFDNKPELRLLINITLNIVVVGIDGYNSFINKLDFSEYKVSSNVSSNKSNYLSDYPFDEIKIENVIIQKNDSLVNVNQIICKYDIITDILKVDLFTNDGLINLFMKNNLNINKDINISFIFGNGDEIPSSNYLILRNTSINIADNNDQYKIVLNWSGNEYSEKLYDSFNFNGYNKYLYWYNLDSLSFESIEVNTSELVNSLNLLDNGEDYTIFELNNSNKFYRIYLIKNKHYKGLIDVTILERNSSDSDFILEKAINSSIPIHDSNLFNVSDFVLKLKWNGTVNKIGYSLKNTSVENQREIGLELNTYEIINFPEISFKVHYSIGATNDSINLKTWKSYKNFIETIKLHLSYALELANSLELKLPYGDKDYFKNGGDNNYDIYIKNTNNPSILGYTNAIDFYTGTTYQNDVLTFINLSCNLNDYNLLKTCFYHEFFHAIQGSYDWFEQRWLSEGLATSFEYYVNNNTITSSLFLPDLFSSQNLSLSYMGNFKMEGDYLRLINDIPGTIINKHIAIEVNEILTEDSKIEINENILDKIKILNSNNSSLVIKDKKIKKNGESNTLYILFEYDGFSRDLTCILTIDSKIVKYMNPIFSLRYYGLFAFFQFLIEKYGIKVIPKILSNSKSFDGFALLEYTISTLTANSKLIDEISDFWSSVLIMRNDNSVDLKYRLQNAQDWSKYYKSNNPVLTIENTRNYIDITDLESTGCKVIDLLFRSENSGTFKITGNFNINYLNLRAVVEYQNNMFQVIKIKPDNYFTLQINSTVYKIKLLIVTDVYYQNYEPIRIETVNTSNLLSNQEVIDRQLFKFSIKVEK